ncbi:hypothetical protein ABIA32_003525 [Streptacidiphilus sp. MAP12-20]|uniref:hypothetical protein n=1 Tax=Streptacidiphilus sp. MAP12-20 TaxID=3156299 RepID=UPI003512C6B9
MWTAPVPSRAAAGVPPPTGAPHGGLAMPAAAGLAMSGAREEDAGLSSGLYNTTAQLGSAGGAAVLTALAAGRSGAASRHGSTPTEALLAGYHLAFGVGAGLLVAAIAVAVVVLRPARERVLVSATKARQQSVESV